MTTISMNEMKLEEITHTLSRVVPDMSNNGVTLSTNFGDLRVTGELADCIAAMVDYEARALQRQLLAAEVTA